uniref:Dynein regulatory complex protein 10 n=1 Tax=Callorhinchus milii TaxID=7868 RepID=V9KKV9_CALMI
MANKVLISIMPTPDNNVTKAVPRSARKQVKIDALKILDPARTKLTSIEAERIISVLENTIKKIERVGLFSYLAENLDRYSVAFGVELMCAMKEYQKIEKYLQVVVNSKYEEPEESKPSRSQKLKAKAKEERMKQERVHNIQILEQALKNSVKDILRLFQGNPVGCHAIKLEYRAEHQTCKELIQGLEELRAFTFERLLVTSTEEREKMKYVQDVIFRDKKNEEVIAALEAELEKAYQDKENEVLKKNDIIRKLKTNLHQLELFSEDYIRQTKLEAEKQQQADMKASELKVTKLQEMITDRRANLTNMITEHRDAELALRKRKYKVETEVENWILKYDADMGEKQEEFEELEKVHKVENSQLTELEGKLHMLEDEYKQIMDEKEVKELERKAKEEELLKTTKAVVTIQAFWKGYKVRQLVKTLRKKKKKKKGKKRRGKAKAGRKGKGKKK